METVYYLIARCVIGIAFCLPLKWVAWCGRHAGAIAWHLDKRHRDVALQNLHASFPEKNESEIRKIARENFRRLGETYSSVLKAGRMKENEISEILTIEGYEKIENILKENPEERIILAAGHFGNFELFSWLRLAAPSVRQWITTYRGLRQRKLTELLLDLRKASGVLFPTACFRTSLGRWKIELGNEIPIRTNGKRRSTKDITLDIIAVHEEYIRRDPANWFWVHNLWKPNPEVDG
jgi:KDO2-lipid IV(A) lauroyltransferase